MTSPTTAPRASRRPAWQRWALLIVVAVGIAVGGVVMVLHDRSPRSETPPWLQRPLPTAPPGSKVVGPINEVPEDYVP